MSGERPRLLDLFSGAGGAAMGYHRAGFEVVGVDIEPQPNYPFEFHQADTFDALADGIRGLPTPLVSHFDAIHASPPCQAYSSLNFYNKRDYPRPIEDLREWLQGRPLPYVIENVPRAPLRDQYQLCGAMFGLRLYRHRDFEVTFPLMVPTHPRHDARCVRNGYLPANGEFMSIHGGQHSKAWRERAASEMGVPWMQTITEVSEAIPPTYTEHVGHYLLAEITATRKAAA